MMTVAGKGNRKSFLDKLTSAPVELDASKADVTARAILECEVVHIDDMTETTGLSPRRRAQPLRKSSPTPVSARQSVCTAASQDGQGIGTSGALPPTTSFAPIRPDSKSLWSRPFAAQAVIAIENVRQFRELQEPGWSGRRRRGRFSARHQPSRDDDNPVFVAILESVARLCHAPRMLALLSLSMKRVRINWCCRLSLHRHSQYRTWGQTSGLCLAGL